MPSTNGWNVCSWPSSFGFAVLFSSGRLTMSTRCRAGRVRWRLPFGSSFAVQSMPESIGVLGLWGWCHLGRVMRQPPGKQKQCKHPTQSQSQPHQAQLLVGEGRGHVRAPCARRTGRCAPVATGVVWMDAIKGRWALPRLPWQNMGTANELRIEFSKRDGRNSTSRSRQFMTDSFEAYGSQEWTNCSPIYSEDVQLGRSRRRRSAEEYAITGAR